MIGVTGGLAEISVVPSGAPADAATLASLGITEEERARVASLYPVNQSLLRLAIPHFTFWDPNQPWMFPADAPPFGGAADDPPIEDECTRASSVIACQSQILGDSFSIQGAPHSLHYSSSWAPGRATERRLQISLTGSTVPASLLGLTVSASVMGQRFVQEFPAAPGQSTEILWDGRDVYGRLVPGRVRASVKVTATYPISYSQPGNVPRAFGQPGIGVLLSPVTQRGFIVRNFTAQLGGVPDPRGGGLGGLTLSGHHQYDRSRGVIFLGSGDRREARSLQPVVGTSRGGCDTARRVIRSSRVRSCPEIRQAKAEVAVSLHRQLWPSSRGMRLAGLWLRRDGSGMRWVSMSPISDPARNAPKTRTRTPGHRGNDVTSILNGRTGETVSTSVRASDPTGHLLPRSIGRRCPPVPRGSSTSREDQEGILGGVGRGRWPFRT